MFVFDLAHLRFKPLHSGDGSDPYATLHQQSNDRDNLTQPMLKQRKKGNPYNYFARNWEQYWRDVILPKAKEAQRKVDLRMEWPSIWECKEIVLKLMALGQVGSFSGLSQKEADELTVEQAEEKIRNDRRAQEYLKDRLSLDEYCSYIVKDIARNLDAFGIAKAAPKTKTYAMDADATEDPAVQRGDQGTAGGDLDGDMDLPSEDDNNEAIRVKPGDAPSKVYHHLSTEQRRKALIFHRERTSKFVKDMINAGLLPLTKDEKAIQEAHNSSTSPPSQEQQHQTQNIRNLANCQTLLARCLRHGSEKCSKRICRKIRRSALICLLKVS